jgi:hypothetical protein
MKIAYDCKLDRPGCAIVQAGFDATPGIANDFLAEEWLLHPTPDMRLYEVTYEQLRVLIKRVNARVEMR